MHILHHCYSWIHLGWERAMMYSLTTVHIPHPETKAPRLRHLDINTEIWNMNFILQNRLSHLRCTSPTNHLGARSPRSPGSPGSPGSPRSPICSMIFKLMLTGRRSRSNWLIFINLFSTFTFVDKELYKHASTFIVGLMLQLVLNWEKFKLPLAATESKLPKFLKKFQKCPKIYEEKNTKSTKKLS